MERLTNLQRGKNPYQISVAPDFETRDRCRRRRIWKAMLRPTSSTS